MKKTLFISLLAILAFIPMTSRAGSPIVGPDWHFKTQVAPLWFGPNAFPVPEMNDGRIRGASVELAGDYFKGNLTEGRDITWDAYFRLHLPLWSDRAALTIWMPMVEFWSYDDSVREARRIESPAADDPGCDSGDIYVALSLQVLTETDRRPGIVIRSVLKSASGNNYGYARYFDCPGYFFDATVGKGFGPLRVAATAGFLCWQTDRGRQNDAVLYGLGAFYEGRRLALSAEWGGYMGWERVGDAPMSIKARAGVKLGHLEPYAFFQRGLKDWPFTQVRVGCAYRF